MNDDDYGRVYGAWNPPSELTPEQQAALDAAIVDRTHCYERTYGDKPRMGYEAWWL